MDLLFEKVELRAQLCRGLMQRGELRGADLRWGQVRAEPTCGQRHLFEIAKHLERFGTGRGLLALGTGAQEEPRVLEQTLAHRSRAVGEGRAELSDLAAAQIGLGHRCCQAPAVLTAAAGNRHQMAHRPMSRDGATTHLLLDLQGQLVDQSQTA